MSCGRRVIRLPRMRHAPSFFAKLRTRLGDQPRCLASSSGVVQAGNAVIGQPLSRETEGVAPS